MSKDIPSFRRPGRRWTALELAIEVNALRSLLPIPDIAYGRRNSPELDSRQYQHHIPEPCGALPKDRLIHQSDYFLWNIHSNKSFDIGSLLPSIMDEFIYDSDLSMEGPICDVPAPTMDEIKHFLENEALFTEPETISWELFDPDSSVASSSSMFSSSWGSDSIGSTSTASSSFPSPTSTQSDLDNQTLPEMGLDASLNRSQTTPLLIATGPHPDGQYVRIFHAGSSMIVEGVFAEEIFTTLGYVDLSFAEVTISDN